MRRAGLLATVGTVTTGLVAGVPTMQTLAPDLLNDSQDARLPAEISAQLVGAGDVRGAGTIHKASGRARLLDG